MVARLGEHFDLDGRPVVLRIWSYDLKDGPRAVATSPDGPTMRHRDAPACGISRSATQRTGVAQCSCSIARRSTNRGCSSMTGGSAQSRSDRRATCSRRSARLRGFGSEPQPPFQNEIVVWRVADGLPLYKVPFDEGFADRVAFDDDGTLYIAALHGARARPRRRPWPRATSNDDSRMPGRGSSAPPGCKETRACPLAMQRTCRTRSYSRAFGIVVDNGARHARIMPDFGMSHGLAVSPGGKRLYASTTLRGVLWDTRTARAHLRYPRSVCRVRHERACGGHSASGGANKICACRRRCSLA